MKKAVAFLLLVAVLAGVFLAALRHQAAAEMTAAAGRFFDLSTGSETEAARRMLAKETKESDSLLKALGSGVFAPAGVVSARLDSLSGGRVTVEMSVGGNRRQVEALMTKAGDTWQVAALPEFLVLPAAYVSGSSPGTALLLDGNGRSFLLSAAEPPYPGSAGAAAAVGSELVWFAPFTPRAVGKLLAVKPDSLEGEGMTPLPLATETAYYKSSRGGVEAADNSDLTVGLRDLTFFLDNGEVRAVLLPETFLPKEIRVALNTTGFGGTLHPSARLSADTAWVLEDKVAGTSFRLGAGQAVSVTASDGQLSVGFPGGETLIFASRLHLTPSAGGRITVHTLERGSPRFTPSYRGKMELAPAGNSVILVNEVSLEEYLYSVVPSEMPVSFGPEPLKVQSVAARSYAVASVFRSGLRNLGAHVDDSTASQVYNNIAEHAEAVSAVRATAGLIAVWEGKVIDARFYSTSSGVGADFSQVWHDRATGTFPGLALSYLVSSPQLRSGQLPAVATEEGARLFFGRTGYDAYDSASPWFRWEVEMTGAELEASLRRNLPAQFKAQPGFVLTKTGGAFVSRQISADRVGRLLDLTVVERGAGGNIMELEIRTDRDTFRVRKELNVRSVLRPVACLPGGRDILLKRHDGSTLKNYALMPSAFFTFEKSAASGGLGQVVFRGGGNGHGVGMSQWGARGLAADGKRFQEILLFYYPGSELKALDKLK